MACKRNSTNRRVVASLLMAGIAASVLVGCSSSGQSDSKVLTVTWAADTKAGIEAAAKRFESANPGVRVDISYLTIQNQFPEITTRLAAGTMSDVFEVWPGNGNPAAAQVLGPKGYLADLSDQPWVNQLPTSFRDVSTSEAGGKGKVVEFITSASAFGALYNTKAMKDAGLTPPSKWSEVIPFCMAAKNAGHVAFALGAATNPIAGVLAPYGMIGTTIYNENPNFDLQLETGEKQFPGSGWKDALDKNLQMAKAGCYQDGFQGAQESDAMAMWSSGQALAIQHLGLAIPGFTDASSTVEFEPFPVTDDPSKINITIGGQEGLAVNAKAKNLDLAKKFVSFMATPEENTKWAASNPGTIPILKSADYKPVNQFQQVVLPFVDKAGPFPDQYWPSAEVQQKLAIGMQEAFAGSKTVDSILTDMQTEYEKDLKAAK